MPEPEIDSDDFQLFPDFVDSDSDGEERDELPVSSEDGDELPVSSEEDGKSSSPPTDSSEDEEDAAAAMAQRRRASRPFVSLQQRRLSKLGYRNVGLQFDALADLQKKHADAVSMQNSNMRRNYSMGVLCAQNSNMRRNSSMGTITASPDPEVYTHSPILPDNAAFSPAKRRWLKALRLIRLMKDPWANFQLENYPEETVIRHRYNPLRKKWAKDNITVKMEKEPFNHGAMRSCYRLRKTGTKHHKASINFVAKVYMEDVERDVYFEDVRLQMDAKLWGEEYNRHHPPKQVDIFQMSIIEFINRPDKPLYHLEHYIDGDYIKYNSNSGFVEESLRLTPQAFSHFTFERSGHKLIIVDVQGVGDLWTDPQIHTEDGQDYGSGNLGTRGFALFFHSHVCNSICKNLRLSPFDLSRQENSSMTKFIQMQKNATTMIKHQVDPVCSPSPTEKVDLTSFLARNRTVSRTSTRTLSRGSSTTTYSDEEDDLPDLPTVGRQRSTEMSIGSPVISTEQLRNLTAKRTRYISESDDSTADSITEEEERQWFQKMANQKQRPSCIHHEIQLRKDSLTTTTVVGDSVLGQIHHDLAKYHELGRFAENENEIDWDAALFHEKLAAELGVMEAMLTMAKLNLGMQPDVLADCTVTPCDESIEDGVKYMLMAANSGDRSSILFMAKAFETGNNLGKLRSRSYSDAVHWYDKAYSMYHEDDDNGEYDGTMSTPQHIIRAKMAELYLEGGYDLDKDPSYAGELYNEAAEDAMNAMKGKLANKYYALAEEAYAQVED